MGFAEQLAGGISGANIDIDASAEVLITEGDWLTLLAAHDAVGISQKSSSGGILVRAFPANTGTLWVGGHSGITAGTSLLSGFPLGAGDAVLMDVQLPTRIWIMASVANQAAAFFVL